MEERTDFLTVSELTGRIKRQLESNFGGNVMVKGEISGFKTSSAGHLYFDLKDEGAVLRTVVFAQTRKQYASVKLDNGQQVRLTGRISLYAASGRYEFIVSRMEQDGLGDLMLRFLELKEKLRAEGLFDSGRKPPLPLLARRIGVVTSLSGAVIHDILSVIDRRYPDTQVLLAPVKVQGEGAAKSIAAAIRFFNARYGAGSTWPADLLIVGRGGGSMEDLWCFNEEEVVRAVAESAIPVISSVGHETDTTLCDLAATRRAATPSVAAELAVPRKADLVALVEKHARSLRVLMQQRVDSLSGHLDRLCASPCLKYPERMTEIPARRVDQLEMRLNHATAGRVAHGRQRLTELGGRYEAVRGRVVAQTRAALDARCVRMQNAAGRLLERARTRLDEWTNKLTLLNPLAILDRGSSVTFAQDGRVLTSPEGVCDGETLTTRLAGGELRSKAVCGYPCPARM